jgi:phosphate transport system substrate-binding protein
MNKACCRLAVLLLLAAMGASLVSSAYAQSLKIGGTGAALGTMRLLGDAIMRSRQTATIEVLPSLGSGGGIKALAANAIDLAVSSRDLKDEERAQGLRSQGYGRTAVVFVTPTSNPIGDVTNAELVALFGGEVNVWRNGIPARAILRLHTESDTKLAEEHIPGLHEAIETARTRSGVPMYFTNQEAADALERIPGSVGTSSLSVILSEKRFLKALTRDGRIASPRSIADGSYPMLKTLYFVLPAEPSQLAKDFLAFTFSSEGQAILEKTGHQAVPDVTG